MVLIKSKLFSNNIKYFLLFLQTGLFGALFAQNYSVFNTANSGLIDNSTTCLSKDSLGNVYVGTQWGLNSFDGSTLVDYSSELLNPSVRCVEFDDNGFLWVGTLGGLSKFDGFSWTHYDTSNGLFDNQINCVAFDSLNQPWVGTSKGVYSYDGRNWHVQLDSSAIEPTFINVTKLSFIGDSLIVCTMNGGIGYLHSGSISWYSSFINNLPDNSSYDVEVTEGGKRLFACPQGGLLMHFSVNTWFNWNIVNTSGFPSNSLTCIEKIDSNLFMAGTLGAGMFEFSFQQGVPITSVYDTSNQSVPENYIVDILKNNDGSIWAATLNSGLVKLGSSSVAIDEVLKQKPFVINSFDLLGRKGAKGLTIKIYSDGSAKKIFNHER